MSTKRAVLILIAVLSVIVAGLSFASDPVVTLSGKVVCAKCTLKKTAACQDLLVVTGDQAGEYYLVPNEVSDAFGHVCMGERAVSATGTVSEKDGKKWLTATKIEPKQS